MSIRIIGRLEIKNDTLVKGIHLEGLRVLGDPSEYAHHFYETGADELLYTDVVASLYGRNSLFHLIQDTAKDVFIPLAVGGGLRTLEDIRVALAAGADKVTLNTAAILNPSLIEEAAKRFGSSTIVVAIEAKKRRDGFYEAYIETGRERTGKGAFEWAREVESLGAGEIIVTSIDREGTGRGFDLDLTRNIAESVLIPVIAHGGAGELDHIVDVVKKGKADAVALSSILHYGHGDNRDVRSGSGLFDRFSSEVKEYQGSGHTPTLIQIKNTLKKHGIDCR